MPASSSFPGRVPVREVLLGVVAGPLGYRRGSSTIGPPRWLGQRGGHRVVDRRGVDADQLHLAGPPATGPPPRTARAVAEVLHVSE